MKKIPLTQNEYALVDNDDFELLKGYRWQCHKEGKSIYAVTGIVKKGKKKTLRMHRVIMKAKPGQHIDHKDGNGLNNQKNNIRFATPSQNLMNSNPRKNNSSKYKGVSFRKSTKKWEAYISFYKKRTHLGFFKDEIDAAKAYDAKAKELFGEFCRLNFPTNKLF